MAAVKAAHEVLHEMGEVLLLIYASTVGLVGCPRVSSSMRFGTRIDKHQTMQDKVDKVEKIIAAESAGCDEK